MSTKRPTSVKLHVEALEDRRVPTTAAFGNGTLYVFGTDRSETIRLNYSGHHIVVQGVGQIDANRVQRVVVDARGGNDFVDLQALRAPATVLGGAGNDVIFGSFAADCLEGGAGNDRIFGLGGNDVLLGNEGDDQLFGVDGNDSLWGGEGNDRLFGMNGFDYLYGQQGSDFLDDGNRAAAEYLDGGSGYDWDADVVAVGGTKMQDVQQRGAPTCSFLATLASLANSGVDFTKWISYAGFSAETGTPLYDVAFWTGSRWTWTRVEFTGAINWSDPGDLSAPERPVTEYESWVILMHRAWVKYHGRDGTSFPHEAMLALSQHAPSVQYAIPDTAFARIAAALGRNLPVVAGTITKPASPRLVGNHAYTVLQVDGTGATRRVLVRNPWGKDGGKETSGNPSDGLVWIWWSDFRANMNYLAVW